MKTKLLTLAFLLFVAGVNAQVLTLTHTGFGCPGTDHPWPHGPVTNSSHHVWSELYKHDGTNYVLQATNLVNSTNWLTTVTLLSAVTIEPWEDYYFVVDNTYEDECAFHTNWWTFSEMKATGTFSGIPLELTPQLGIGQSYNKWNVAANSTYELIGGSLFTINPYFVGTVGEYREAIHRPANIDMIPAYQNPTVWPEPAVQPRNGNRPQMQMNAHHHQVFALYSSTNLTDWVLEGDVVADEWGWLDVEVGMTNLLSQQFFKLTYTNAP